MFAFIFLLLGALQTCQGVIRLSRRDEVSVFVKKNKNTNKNKIQT
jgi:hypothetical protein